MYIDIEEGFLLVFCVFCMMFAGCGKDKENYAEPQTGAQLELEAEQEIEQESKAGSRTETENLTVKEAYYEILEEGKQVCPEFPEVETLAQVDEQYLLDSICPAVVRLEDGNLFGSGIIWKMEADTIWVLTNQHMLMNKSENTAANEEVDELIDVVFWDGIRAVGEVVKLSEDYDLGIVKVNLQEMGYYTATRYFSVRYSEEAYEAAGPGDDIFIIGSADYPAGNLYYGTIGNRSIYMDSFGTEMLWAYCEVKAGMSGSGVFDAKGNLLGIVCAGNEEKEAAVLPIDKILAEWEGG